MSLAIAAHAEDGTILMADTLVASTDATYSNVGSVCKISQQGSFYVAWLGVFNSFATTFVPSSTGWEGAWEFARSLHDYAERCRSLGDKAEIIGLAVDLTGAIWSLYTDCEPLRASNFQAHGDGENIAKHLMRHRWRPDLLWSELLDVMTGIFREMEPELLYVGFPLDWFLIQEGKMLIHSQKER